MHISDLHLDSKLNELDFNKSGIRRSEIKKSFENAIGYAKENNADVILISGDIFDNEFVLDSTIEFVKKVLNGAKDIKIFISCGNHDPYKSDVYKKLIGGLNDNTVVFSPDATECFELEDIKLRIYGRSFAYSENIDPLLSGFKAADDDFANIMVMHGEVTSSESVYNPISTRDIAESNLTYLALGHTHQFSQILKTGNTFYAYPGTHEGHGFDECGKKGFIFGDVTKENVNLSFVPLGIREYKCIEIDISEFSVLEEITEKIKENINEKDLFKIVLKGYRNENITINDAVIKNELDAFFVKIYDRTKLKFDFEKIKNEKNLRGAVVKNVLNDITDENRKFMEKVLEKIAEFF
jgi:DNA repair exonuclease SbcCD nuclease subunit